MMKHLKIEVNGQEWVNGEFVEVSFTDGPGGVRIEGKAGKTPAATGGGGLLDILASASKARTASVAQQKRTELAAEPVEAEPID